MNYVNNNNDSNSYPNDFNFNNKISKCSEIFRDYIVRKL